MSIYDTLNEQQKLGVITTEGPVLILAGAGSGKTRVLTHRTAYLIEEKGVNPWNILAITFTNKAAGEMRERVDKIVGYGSESIWVSTFHSTCVRILRRHIDRLGFDNRFAIYDTDDQKTLMKEVCRRMNIDTKIYKERSLLAQISHAKDELITPDEMELNAGSDFNKKKVAAVYREYQASLRKNNALDFDDLIVKTVELFQNCGDVLESYQERFKYIMVDEYQDTNTAQFKFVSLLASRYENLCVVGDDDQSIYRFRGAKPEIMLNFQKDFPKAVMIQLAENYRSTECIIKGAGRVIAHNTNRFQKSTHGIRGNGEKITISFFQNQAMEALAVVKKVQDMLRDGREPQEIAVLFRTNTGARIYLEKFMEYNLPFRMRDGLPNIYEHWIANDLFTYIRIANGNRSRKDFLQIINRPNRYISRDYLDSQTVTLEGLRQKCQGRDWMEDRIDRLEYDLSCIAKMKPYAAINYIRHAVGYEEYLREYAQFRRIKPEELYEVLDELQEAARSFDTFDAWYVHMEEYKEALQKKSSEQKEEAKAVVFTTLHSAKGLEFPVVFLVDAVEGNMPHRKAVMDVDIQEERRLFYVGMTRAKDKLYLYYAKERYGQELSCSRFIEELRGDGTPKPGQGEKRRQTI